MNIEKFSTKDLVEELSKREGVQKLETPPEGRDEIYIEYKSDDKLVGQSIHKNTKYDERQEGPAIILRIID